MTKLYEKVEDILFEDLQKIHAYLKGRYVRGEGRKTIYQGKTEEAKIICYLEPKHTRILLTILRNLQLKGKEMQLDGIFEQ